MTELIGNTPLIPLDKLSVSLKATIFAKAEMFNPSGSIKDRLAKYLIESSERDGSLKPGGTVIEVTSGNTGIAVSWICSTRGYKAVIVMSDKNSREKRDMMKTFGAELFLTPHTVKPDDPRSNYNVAEELSRSISNSIYLDQYNNPANIRCHYETTGPEIWRDSGGKIDCLIAGAGTGGTISGVGKFLKEQNPNIKIIAVDSEGSIFKTLFDGGELKEGSHYEVEGIGGDKPVKALDFTVIDEFHSISDKDAFLTARELSAAEGIFAGGSSGAVLAAARSILERDQTIKYPVVILADSGNRYLSKIYNDKWMKEMGFLKSS
ncbi:MAG: cysteine synthase family protein [candidate division Zixibacteria bacterium]